MHRHLKIFYRYLYLSFLDDKLYLSNFYFSFLYIPLQLLIVYFFWRSTMIPTLEESLFQKPIDFIKYYVCLAIIQMLLSPALFVTFKVYEQIHSGQIANIVTRPVSHFFTELATSLSKLLLRICFITLLTSILAIVFWPIFHGPDFQLLWVQLVKIFKLLPIILIFLIFSFIILFQIQYTVALFSPRLKNVLTFRDNIMDTLMILGGVVVPIDIFPEFLKSMISYTPIALVYYIPSRILSTGAVTHNDLISMALQLLWIFALYLLITVLWKKMIIGHIEHGG